MADRIKKIKIKQADGSFSDYMPIGADAWNIDFNNGYSLEQVMGEINPDEEGTIATQLKEMKKNPIKMSNFFLGLFFQESSPYIVDWYVSQNGVEWSKIPAPTSLQLRDITMQFNKKDNYFYRLALAAYNKVNIYRSKDLKTWETKQIQYTVPGTITWAPDLYIDENGILYIIVSNKYGEETVINGDTHPAFDMYLIKCTDYENLTFEDAYKLNVYAEDGSLSPNRNHIDGSLIKINDTFYLTAKNEYSKINEIFSSTDLKTWTLVTSNITDSTLWTEGPQCVVTENNVYYYADLYTDGSYIVGKVPKSTFPTFSSSTARFNLMESIKAHRHGTVLYIDNDYAKSVISNLPGFSFENILQSDNKYRKNIAYLDANNGHLYKTGKLPIFPNSIFSFQGEGSVSLHLRNLFGLDETYLGFAAGDNKSITITGVDNSTFSNPPTLNNSRSINEKIFTFPLAHQSWMCNPLEWFPHQRKTLSSLNESSGIVLGENINGEVRVHRIGHVATIMVQVRYIGELAEGAVKEWPTIATLDATLRPYNSSIIIPNDLKRNLQFFSDGTIKVDALNSNTIYGTATYLIK